MYEITRLSKEVCIEATGKVKPWLMIRIKKLIRHLMRMFKECNLAYYEMLYICKKRKGKANFYLKRLIKRYLGWYYNWKYGDRFFNTFCLIGGEISRKRLVLIYSEAI